MNQSAPINFREPKNLICAIDRRKVLIWGARHDGYAARLALQRYGITITSYIDSSPALKGTSAFGLHIISSDSFFEKETPSTAFVVVASGFFADEIGILLESHGWRKDVDFAVYGELRRFNYQVDVAGMCNLKCISCPRGNWPRHRKPGFMSAETYGRLVDKILLDDPWTGIITLYNWGEPLLNPALSEIIRITREKGLLSAISSNLAMKKDFENVVKAGPTWFRISNSGWGDNYEITHTGAKWDVFLANCRKLSVYKEQHCPEMLVELFFHIYSHNRNDFPKMQKLCDELGFTLRYRHAALAPLDNIECVVEGKSVTAAARKTREIQFLHVEEVMEIARAERGRPCFYMDHLWIDWDLSIAHCMEWYDPDLKLFKDRDFLSVTPDEIETARLTSTHCKNCMARGIHRAYCVYGDEKLIAKKSSIPVQKEE
jgi:MoaA/NifB/PqqE/SkfB family radical SAM enzyme